MKTDRLVTFTTETITGYASITETLLLVATLSTTFRTISVKKYTRPSTISSVQTREASQTAYTFSISSTSSEEPSSTTTSAPLTSSLSSSITSTQNVQNPHPRNHYSIPVVLSKSHTKRRSHTNNLHHPTLHSTTNKNPNANHSPNNIHTQVHPFTPASALRTVPSKNPHDYLYDSGVNITRSITGFLLHLETTKKTGAESAAKGAGNGEWKGFEEEENDL
ncbi:hypothetical protein HYALB_00007817 [Hymenoscyphus albidus]|uniref:Uncharacterized protein n=1 Tax=Hymenoscyphus albidus TaxID=595503 RepID=A0A9N9LI08_9HELO|nr:hypothetical protein HYALB_00007817 [Hymenoscyphus albidus]